MYKLRIGTIPIPPIYICEEQAEVLIAESRGVPYLVKPKGISEKMLVKLALYQTLIKLFPDINWKKQLGISSNKFYEVNVHVPGNGVAHQSKHDEVDYAIVDYSDEERKFSGGVEEDYYERPLDKYVGDLSAYVNIEELQDLNLLPSFLSDITDSIRRNVYGSRMWSEGYNKKLDAALGNFNQDYEAPNLIILDISGSIPRGVSATMLTLIHTLKERAHADVIVTGSTSYYWKYSEELPTPQWLRDHIGYGNESFIFHKILKDHILGHHWGNVIVFGDNDSPSTFKETYSEDYMNAEQKKDPNYRNMFANTSVKNVMFYHTRQQLKTGYGKWIFEIDDKVPFTINTEWCKFMKD